ncbi:opioid growth factor receptor [Spea bombifrons]|uniref:opioid growth factor receptor n=1 Tax=Spea bombifrons TaxID=233779 RepID=UPI00234A47EC|nr:opioid growth factor receptor [Spea bombifrons]
MHLDSDCDSWDEAEEKEWDEWREWERDSHPDSYRREEEYYRREQRLRASKDLRKYRCGYPNNRDYPSNRDQSPSEMPNLAFYQNRIPFKPYGEYIDVILKEWESDYDRLEDNHSYIQWLFPLRERGMNWKAKPLTLAEIEMLRKDDDAMRRFLKAYKLMLDFYGVRLVDEETGEVARAENWKERFANLNDHSHNNLRITRILKCLGELGFERFQAPLVKFFLAETLCNKELSHVKSSVLDYFMFTVKDKKQRRELVLFAWKHYQPREKFIWGPKKILGKCEIDLENETDKSSRLEMVGVEKTHENMKAVGIKERNGDEKNDLRGEENIQLLADDKSEDRNVLDQGDVVGSPPESLPVREDLTPGTITCQSKKRKTIANHGDGIQNQKVSNEEQLSENLQNCIINPSLISETTNKEELEDKDKLEVKKCKLDIGESQGCGPAAEIPEDGNQEVSALEPSLDRSMEDKEEVTHCLSSEERKDLGTKDEGGSEEIVTLGGDEILLDVSQKSPGSLPGSNPIPKERSDAEPGNGIISTSAESETSNPEEKMVEFGGILMTKL